MREVAVGIVSQADRVLVCQRSRDSRYPLKWEFPGGKLEPGEAPETALARELHEELNIVPAGVESFFTQEWVYPDGRPGGGNDGEFRVYYYLVRTYTGKPVNNVFEQIRWVRPSELLELDILEGNREAVSLLMKHAETEKTPGHAG